MGRPNIFFKDGKWRIVGKGEEIASFGDDGIEIGRTGQKIAKIYSFIGSASAIAAIGTQTSSVGTITNATGLIIGDKVFGNCLSALPIGLVVGGFFVATTNCLNFTVTNSLPNTAGSLPSYGWNILATRTNP